MILYFADRTMQILGMASTDLSGGVKLKDDSFEDEVGSGTSNIEVDVLWSDRESQHRVEQWTTPGNYVLCNSDRETKFFTIIDRERNLIECSANIYIEDGGLELLNTMVDEYEVSDAHNIEWYISKFISNTGFQIGVNEGGSSTKALTFESEQTITERLVEIADDFDCEISYSFDFHGLMVIGKYVNIYSKRGRDTEINLQIGREIKNLIIKDSVSDLATALLCKGDTPSGADNPITLKGFSYDDGDIYIDGKYLKSRSALKTWSRLAWEIKASKNDEGHIIKFYKYDTKKQSTLCNHAVKELKRISKISVEYEAEINYLPGDMQIGDRCIILDKYGDFHTKVRLMTLKKSHSGNTYDATFDIVDEE